MTPEISTEFIYFLDREILTENDEHTFRGVQLKNTKGYLNEFISKYLLLSNEKGYDENIFFIGEFSKFIAHKIEREYNPDIVNAIKDIIPIIQEFTKPYLDREEANNNILNK